MILTMSMVREGDLEISGDHTVTQRVTGSITVNPGSSLVLMGVAEGGVVVRGGGLARIAGTTNGLFVAIGGHAVLTGTCVGSVTNDGGDLTIDGVVTCDLIEHAGTTRVAPGAIIHHGRLPA
jgi:hypothetical protein